MKYFTKDMLRRFQTEDNDDVYNTWRKNAGLYSQQLRKLKLVLSKRSYNYFISCHRHDDIVMNINIINNGSIYCQENIPKEVHFQNNVSNPVEIHINVLCPLEYRYVLKYKNVNKCIIDYPSSSPLWLEGRAGLGSWGYDELSYTKKGLFKHEIMLHSGALITIEFKKFCYLKTKCNK